MARLPLVVLLSILGACSGKGADDAGDSGVGDSGDSGAGDSGDSGTGDSGDSGTGDSGAGDSGDSGAGDADHDGIPAGEDCDDGDPEVGGPTDWFFDGDGDGAGDDATRLSSCGPPGTDYVPYPGDCDDGDASVNPMATEVCGNGVDDDCDGATTECRLGAGWALADALLDLSLVDGAYAGLRMAALDLDDDGATDLLVADPFRTSAGGSANAGAVYVVAGPVAGALTRDATSAAVLEGPVRDTELSALDAGGDFDGDGRADVVVGGAYYTDGVANQGGVWLVVGGTSLAVGGVGIDAVAAQGWKGDDYQGYLGTDVQFVGDMDGDGLDELALGGIGWGTLTGAVLLLPGDASWSGGMASTGDIDAFTWTGSASYDYLGGGDSLCPAVDFDGDGLDDLLMGEYRSGDNGYFSGAIHVIYGDSALALPADGVVDDAEDASFHGAGEYTRLGEELAPAGDQDGDGYEDVWSASSYASAAGGYGVVRLLPGQGGAYGTGVDPDAVALARLEGDVADQAFGENLAASDLDGDGQVDLAVSAGAYLSTVAPPSATSPDRSVYVYYGALSGSYVATDADGTLSLGADGAQFGAALLAADLDGNGIDELLVGQPGMDEVFGFTSAP